MYLKGKAKSVSVSPTQPSPPAQTPAPKDPSPMEIDEPVIIIKPTANDTKLKTRKRKLDNIKALNNTVAGKKRKAGATNVVGVKKQKLDKSVVGVKQKATGENKQPAKKQKIGKVEPAHERTLILLLEKHLHVRK